MLKKIVGIVFVFFVASFSNIFGDSIDSFAGALKSISSKKILKEEEQNELDKKLIKAAEKNDLESVKNLVSQGADIDFYGVYIYEFFEEYMTALMYFAEKNNFDAIKYLVDEGADVNKKNFPKEENALSLVDIKYPEIIKYLVEKGSNLEFFYDKSVLMKASESGNFDLVEYLVGKGALINKKPYHTITSVLLYAIYGHEPKIVEFLLRHGANFTTDNLKGEYNKDLYVAIEQFFKYATHPTFPVGSPDKALAEKTLEIIKILLSNNASFSKDDRAYKRTAGYQNIQVLFNEILDYKNDVKSMFPKKALENAITHNGANNSGFNKYEWLTFAILNNNATQIQYCVEQKIFKPIEILEGLVLRPHMPLTAFDWLWNRVDKKEQEKLEELAQEHKNQKFLDAIVKFKLIKFEPPKDINIIYK